MRGRDRLLAAAAGLSRRIRGDPGRRPEPRRHRAGRARCRGGARRRRPPHRVVRAGAAGGMDGQALGAAPGRRGGRRRCRSRRLISSSPTPISSTRPDALQQARRAGAIGRLLVLTSLMAKLRCESSRRAHVHPGLHLLLPDALSVRLGERSAPRHRRRGRRLHAGAPRCAAPSRRHGRDPQRLDRRLRAGEACSKPMARSGSD